MPGAGRQAHGQAGISVRRRIGGRADRHAARGLVSATGETDAETCRNSARVGPRRYRFRRGPSPTAVPSRVCNCRRSTSNSAKAARLVKNILPMRSVGSSTVPPRERQTSRATSEPQMSRASVTERARRSSLGTTRVSLARTEARAWSVAVGAGQSAVEGGVCTVRSRWRGGPVGLLRLSRLPGPEPQPPPHGTRGASSSRWRGGPGGPLRLPGLPGPEPPQVQQPSGGWDRCACGDEYLPCDKRVPRAVSAGLGPGEGGQFGVLTGQLLAQEPRFFLIRPSFVAADGGSVQAGGRRFLVRTMSGVGLREHAVPSLRCVLFAGSFHLGEFRGETVDGGLDACPAGGAQSVLRRLSLARGPAFGFRAGPPDLAFLRGRAWCVARGRHRALFGGALGAVVFAAFRARAAELAAVEDQEQQTPIP